MRLWRLVVLPAVLATVVAACDRDPSETADANDKFPGRLVASRMDTSIFVIQPDGSDRIDLVVEQPGLAATQPTWSPDASRLVWTEVDHMSELPQASIVRSDGRGQDFDRTPSPIAPFYYYWSPTGDRFAFLAGGPNGTVELGVLNGEVSRLGGAQPFYFAWSPDGGTLLTHIDLETVGFLTPDGAATTLEETQALFQAPQWSADGTRLVYASGTPPPTGGIRTGAFQTNGQDIVVADTNGAILHRVGPFAGVATFELNPDGNLLAHSATVDRNSFNFAPLIVTDLESGEPTTVSLEFVLAYQWSPTGDSLLYLAVEDGVDHPAFRWAVWDGEDTTAFAPVTLTTSFASRYLPFWDQYSRSHTLWAPDGSAFAYSGLDDQGEEAIWVQVIGEPGPRNVASGDVVFWSPK